MGIIDFLAGADIDRAYERQKGLLDEIRAGARSQDEMIQAQAARIAELEAALVEAGKEN